MAACNRAWISDVGRGASATGRCRGSVRLDSAEDAAVSSWSAAAGRSGIAPETDEPGWPTVAGRSESGTWIGASFRTLVPGLPGWLGRTVGRRAEGPWAAAGDGEAAVDDGETADD
jgi:hypothetical protein